MKRIIVLAALLIAAPCRAQYFYSLTRSEQPLSDAPSNVDVIPSSSWKNSTARTVGDVIDYEPGVIINKYGGPMGFQASPSIRGFTSQQVLVVIDDVPQSPGLTGNVDLSRIPLDNVDRIEIIRGGASAVYGPNAEGGVVHIITKTPKHSLEAEYVGTVGSFDTYTNRALAGTQTGPLQLQVTGSRDLSSGFQQNGYYHNTNLTGLLAYDAEAYGKLTYYSSGASGVVGLPSGTPIPISQWNGTVEQQAVDTISHQNERDNNDRIQYDNRIGVVDLTARLANNITDLETYEFGVDQHVRTEGRNAFAKADVAGLGSVGYEFYQRRLDSDVFGIARDNAWGTYAEFYLFSNDIVKLIPGGRYDHDNTYGDAWSPRIQLVVKPNQYWKVSASADRSFQAPTFADLYNPFANPGFQFVQLNPEITWSYNLGLTAIPATGVETNLNIFRADTRDRIGLDVNTGYAAFNFSRAYSQGLEASLAYSFSRIRQTINYTYLEAFGEFQGSNYEWLAATPKHLIQYRLDANLPCHITIGDDDWTLPCGVTFTNKLKYLHRQWTGLGETGTEIPGYVTDDIRIAEKFGDVDVFIESDNMLNRHYAENAYAADGYYPMPGRTYSGGVSIRFQAK